MFPQSPFHNLRIYFLTILLAYILPSLAVLLSEFFLFPSVTSYIAFCIRNLLHKGKLKRFEKLCRAMLSFYVLL